MAKNQESNIFNPKNTKQQRRYLRNNMTKAEIILWSKLKRRRILNYKFRRQHGIGDCIVDFYCPEVKLAIEVDGESHYTKKGKAHDKKRKAFMFNHGIKVLRFTNKQIKENLEGVVKHLIPYIKDLETE